MTRDYFGDASPTWPLTIPDLSTVGGIPSGPGLQAGPVWWQVRIASGEMPEWPTLPPDGLTVRTALTSGHWPR